MKEIKDLKLQELGKLAKLSEKELRAELTRSSKELFSVRMKKEVGELKQTHLIKALRRYIAQINTVAKANGLNVG